MKLGIMQPYFFPYIGYFDLINSVDKWIVFDTAQYIRHGWVNRNRILHPDVGDQYIVVPLQKHERDTPIRDIKISKSVQWRNSIMGQLTHYKKYAPYYGETRALVEDCLSGDESSLSYLNVSILSKVCERLGIRFEYTYFSEMELDLDPIFDPGDWALRISEALGADEYINPPGGADLFDVNKFAASRIKLSIKKLIAFEYRCRKYQFMPALSIVDVLMWNSPTRVKEHLDRVK